MTIDGQDFVSLKPLCTETFCDIYLALCVCAATIAAVWLEAKVLYGPYQLQIVI